MNRWEAAERRYLEQEFKADVLGVCPICNEQIYTDETIAHRDGEQLHADCADHYDQSLED